MNYKGFIWICGLIFSVLLIPHLSASISLNQGNLLFYRSLIASAGGQGYFIFREPSGESALLTAATHAFDRALRWDSSNKSARWSKARTALAAGRAQEAAAYLPARSAPANPLIFVETLLAHSLIGDDSAVLNLADQYHHERFPIWDEIFRDTIAVTALNQADRQIASGSLESVLPALHEVLRHRPFDLYANYWLYREATERGDESAADAYYRKILNFPIEAVSVRDQRLLGFVFKIYPELISDELWGTARGQNLVSYWIWQYPRSSAVSQLLKDLVNQFPDEPQWRFLQEKAEQLQGNQNFPPGSFTHTGQQDTAQAAKLLGLSPENVLINSGLAIGGSIPKVLPDQPQGWKYEVYAGPEGHAFIAGTDSLDGIDAARIANLWWPQIATKDKYYAQYLSYPNVPEEVDWLVLSFWYKAAGGLEDIGLAYFGTLEENPQYIINFPLQSTSGKWVQVFAVGKAVESSSKTALVLRNWGNANIWFKDVQIRPLSLSATPPNCFQEACVFAGRKLEKP